MNNSFWDLVNQSVSSAIGEHFRGRASHGPGGGCINASWLLEDRGLRYFVKTNQESLAEMFAVEAAGLRAIAETGTIRVPDPICHGSGGGRSWLVLEWLDLGHGQDWRAMGQSLARLHQCSAGATFGWENDNFIGATPQPNQPHDDWISFFGEQRLGFQIKLAHQKGGRVPAWSYLKEALPQLLDFPHQAPSLLHGDLWSGNAGFTKSGEPVIFDVAVYRGHGEADLAMTELFGGFPREFYGGYEEISPIDRGYAQRRTLYNLYHILNHYNLFGGSYLQQANRMIDELLK